MFGNIKNYGITAIMLLLANHLFASTHLSEIDTTNLYSDSEFTIFFNQEGHHSFLIDKKGNLRLDLGIIKGTFSSPPDVAVFTLNNEDIVILMQATTMQVGIASDNFIIYTYNKRYQILKTQCTYIDIGVADFNKEWPDDAIFLDYEINVKENFFLLKEYYPCKSIKNTFKTNVQKCTFDLNIKP